jgi:hypothetical protein
MKPTENQSFFIAKVFQKLNKNTKKLIFYENPPELPSVLVIITIII